MQERSNCFVIVVVPESRPVRTGLGYPASILKEKMGKVVFIDTGSLVSAKVGYDVGEQSGVTKAEKTLFYDN